MVIYKQSQGSLFGYFSKGSGFMKHYVVIHSWANEEEADGLTVIGVAHSYDDAKEVFDKAVLSEKIYAEENDFEVYEDSDNVFDAGEEGYHSINHTKVVIMEVL